MGAEENKASFRQALEAFNSVEDRAGWLAAHDPTVTAHGLGPEPLNFEGVEHFYTMLWRTFPDVQSTIEDLVAEGDKVAQRWTVRGTHREEFMGIPATGKSVTLTGQTLFRFSGGKIVERWTNFDALGLMVQLGAVQAPPS